MLGFWIHPTHQGRGYATEAASVLVEFAFERLGAGMLVSAHATWNVASGKVLEAIGMHKVRKNPRGFQKRGRWVEEYVYELPKPRGA
jgi:[ribosomal protein S5]-alanine N-acetyltransferase